MTKGFNFYFLSNVRTPTFSLYSDLKRKSFPSPAEPAFYTEVLLDEIYDLFNMSKNKQLWY